MIKQLIQEKQEPYLATAATDILIPCSSQSSSFFLHDFVDQKKGEWYNISYTLFIECKACRNGNHIDCSSKQGNEDTLVRISCTCLLCNNQEGGKNNIVR